MLKKILTTVIVFSIVLLMTSCTNNKESIKFKKEYESLNGVVNTNGNEYRKVNIPKNNPFIISTAKEIISKIENKETFYVYFGSELCPWCRSVIEKAVEIANLNEISKVYYVDVWDDEGNEILRDKYVLDDQNKAILAKEGTDDYFKLLDYLDSVLPEYTYAANKNGGAKLNIEEKRIYLPTFIYIANGIPTRYTSGLSELQTKSREELTKEMLLEEENLFNDFFINICDESC